MGGHVVVGQTAVLGFDQHVAIGPNQDRAEGMIAICPCTASNVEGAA